MILMIITTFITYFLETISSTLIACKTIQHKITDIFKFLFYNLVLSIPLATVELIILNPSLLYVIQALLYILGFAFYFKQSLIKSVFQYIFTFILTGLLQYLMVIPILAFPNIKDFVYYPVIALWATSFLCLVIYLWIPIERLYNVTLASDLVIRIVIFNLYLILMFGSFYYKLHTPSFYETFAIILLYLCTFISINLDAVYTHIKLKKKEAELHAYQQYQPIVDSLIQEIRMRQHNYDNAIQSFASLPLTCPDYESITAALNTYTKEAFHNNIELKLLKLNERLVAGLLYTKIQEAQNQRKLLYVNIKNYALQTIMPEYLLMQCVGVLVDNAIEAVSEDSVITLHLSSQNGQTIIEVKNSGPHISDTLLKKMFEDGYTTKSDTTKKHGFGLPFLKKCIKQYNGSISCSNHLEEGVNHIMFRVIV